jgi:hypothetical protein
LPHTHAHTHTHTHTHAQDTHTLIANEYASENINDDANTNKTGGKSQVGADDGRWWNFKKDFYKKYKHN